MDSIWDWIEGLGDRITFIDREIKIYGGAP